MDNSSSQLTPDSQPTTHPYDSLFLRACRREPVERTPVWLMRQAGRYMKDYRDLRGKVSFLELCKDPALAAEVTVNAQKKLDADAAIIFSDILVLLEPMGLTVNYLQHGGPSIVPTLTHAGSVDRLSEADPAELGYVYEAVRQTKQALPKDVPLLGFVGAPFTLASYMIEGGSVKQFAATKKFMQADAGRWNVLMEKTARSAAAHLNAQIEAGCDAVQVFDSWAGALTGEEYRTYAQPYTKLLIQSVKKGVPVIHFSTRTGDFLEDVASAGGDVIGIDQHLSLGAAWRRIGYDKALQGNLDPLALCTDRAQIESQVRRILAEAGGRPGHIFNLGHGVLPETPEANAVMLVKMVKELSSKK